MNLISNYVIFAHMEILGLFILAVGLSMDAFAIAICKGLSVSKVNVKHCIITGLWFGGFQALMPLLGYLIGNQFITYVAEFDHWIAFGLLFIIGINMIRESRSKEVEELEPDFSFFTMLLLSIADSIDALAAGISLGFEDINIWGAIAMISIVTFIFSVIGLKIGNKFGLKYKSKAELLGGIILICIGANVLIEHLIGI